MSEQKCPAHRGAFFSMIAPSIQFCGVIQAPKTEPESRSLSLLAETTAERPRARQWTVRAIWALRTGTPPDFRRIRSPRSHDSLQISWVSLVRFKGQRRSAVIRPTLNAGTTPLSCRPCPCSDGPQPAGARKSWRANPRPGCGGWSPGNRRRRSAASRSLQARPRSSSAYPGGEVPLMTTAYH